MKKQLKKIILILLVVLLIGVVMYNVTSEATYSAAMASLLTQQNNWSDNSSATGKVEDAVFGVLSIVRIVGMCIAVVMLLTVAMKYMAAAPGEKADIKKASVAYVVGAFVLFGAVGLLGIISDFASNISKS